jgi:4-oxalomesaconate tautomerase
VKRLSVEHPSGEFSLEIEVEEKSGGVVKVTRSSLIRTARALFRGELLIPASIWDGKDSQPSSVKTQAAEKA